MISVQSFLDWFDGFREGIDGVPSEKQWKRICERIGEIEVDADVNGASVTPVTSVPPPAPNSEIVARVADELGQLGVGADKIEEVLKFLDPAPGVSVDQMAEAAFRAWRQSKD